MDKEIIIDGVDVAGCCYYEQKNDTGEWCDLTCTKEHAPYFRCESMPNCYYKQIKRLEQENARLKEKVEFLQKEDAAARRLINRMQKDVMKADKYVDKSDSKIQKLKTENERLMRLNASSAYDVDNLLKEKNKYKQTLQEIKDYLNTLSGIDNDFVNTETYLRILDLITKAEEE